MDVVVCRHSEVENQQYREQSAHVDQQWVMFHKCAVVFSFPGHMTKIPKDKLSCTKTGDLGIKGTIAPP